MSKRSTITFKRYGALPPPKVDIASATHNAKGEPYACYNLSTGEITPGVIKYRIKSHKQKDKPMWIKTEDNKNIWNLTKLANIEIFVRDSMHHVGFSGGFHSCTIKSFKYKEDAEKYLDELLEKLNDEC